jgi:hypothetical protein
MGFELAGCGATALTTGVNAAARWGAAGTAAENAACVAVEEAGAVTVTLVMLLMTVVLCTLLIVVTRIPGLMMGGAPMTTCGETPIGAGTMSPKRDPGGGGMKGPGGPKMWGPKRTPAATTAKAMSTPTGGGVNADS